MSKMDSQIFGDGCSQVQSWYDTVVEPRVLVTETVVTLPQIMRQVQLILIRVMPAPFLNSFKGFFFLQSVFPNQWKETAVTPVHIGDLMQTPQNTVWFPSWVLISKDFG